MINILQIEASKNASPSFLKTEDTDLKDRNKVLSRKKKKKKNSQA